MTKLMTLQEVAERLHVSKATANRLIKNGTIPGIFLSRSVHRNLIRVREEALEAAVVARENARAQLKRAHADDDPRRVPRARKRFIKSVSRS